MLHATTSLPDSISDNLPNPKIKQGKSLFYNSMLLQFVVVVIVVNRYQSMFADWMNESLFVLLSFLMTRPIRSDMTLSTARGWNLKIVTNIFNTRFSKTKQNEAEKSLFIFLLFYISSRIFPFPFLFLFPFLLLLLLFIIRYYLSIVFSCCCCSCC